MQTFLRLIRTAERTAVVTLFLSMVGLYFVNVLAREFGGSLASDLDWIEEAVRLMSLFLVFLSVGLALEKARHVGVDTWRDRIAAATGIPVRRIIDAIGIVACLYLAFLSVSLASLVYATGQRSPTLNMPIFWIYLAPAIGFCLLALRYALSLFGVIDRFDVASETPLETAESER